MVGLAGLMLVGLTLKATRDAVAETRRVGEAQARAYVYAKNAELRHEYASTKVKLYCANTGQSPARYFRIGIASAVLKLPTGGNITVPSDLAYKTWTGLGANDIDTVNMYPDDMAMHIYRAGMAEEPGKVAVFVVGRIIYGDIFGDEWESEFSFFVRPPFKHGVRKMSRSTAQLRAYQGREKGSG